MKDTVNLGPGWWYEGEEQVEAQTGGRDAGTFEWETLEIQASYPITPNDRFVLQDYG